jgi:hypothetical protein
VGDYVSYDYDDLTIGISDVTTRENFDTERNAIVHETELYKNRLKDSLKTNKYLLESIKKMNYSPDIVTDQEDRIKNWKSKYQK